MFSGVSENKDPGSTVDGVSEAPERSKEGERVADPLDSYRNNVATTQPTTNVPETKPQRSENGAVTGKKRPRDESESEASPSGTPEKAGAEKDRGGVGAASRRSARLAQSMDETPGKRVNRGAENGAEDCLEKEKILGTTPEERPGPGECAADEEADEEGAENRGEVEDETEAEEIPVSSMVIAAKSLVLRRMMLSEMKEAQRDAPIILKVTQEGERVFAQGFILNVACNGSTAYLV